jgi:hypothetical protein
LTPLFELDAQASELEALMELHPSERRKALNQKLSPIFRIHELPDLEGGLWPSSLPRGAYRTHQLVQAEFARETLSLEVFLEQHQAALEKLEAEFEPGASENWRASAQALEAWRQLADQKRGVAPLHGSILPDGLEGRAEALADKLRERVAARTRESFSSQDGDYFASLGWSFLTPEPELAPMPVPVPATETVSEEPTPETSAVHSPSESPQELH